MHLVINVHMHLTHVLPVKTGCVMDPRTRVLLEAPIGPTLLRLALPNVVVMVVQSAIGLIETYFVGKLGTDALAGMALVFPLLMLIQMVSAGAMGGGILSAVARALGSDRRDDANRLVWHAVAIAIGLGVATTALALAFGPGLYALMGGRGGSLAAAVLYSNLVLLGAVPLWLYNSLAAVIRGTGNMIIPAAVTALGAVVLIPLSPALIFGFGPLPRLGIAGGAVAFVLFYSSAARSSPTYLWSGRGVLRPPLRPPPLAWAPTREILRVGAVSSLVEPHDQCQHRHRDRPCRRCSARRRSPVTAPARGSNICWSRWCSVSARRSPPWSAPRSAPAGATARCGSRGPARRLPACSPRRSGLRPPLSRRRG